MSFEGFKVSVFSVFMECLQFYSINDPTHLITNMCCISFSPELQGWCIWCIKATYRLTYAVICMISVFQSDSFACTLSAVLNNKKGQSYCFCYTVNWYSQNYSFNFLQFTSRYIEEIKIWHPLFKLNYLCLSPGYCLINTIKVVKKKVNQPSN